MRTMIRKLLLLHLTISLILELAISVGGIGSPATALQLFKIAATPDTRFLAFVVGWLCLFVSLICARLLYCIWKRTGDCITIGYLLGAWWLGIGIDIYIAFGKTDNLWLDSLKGLLLLILINRYQGTLKAKK